MLKALLKTTALWPIGWMPGGPGLYHRVTCGLLGSQSFHPPKLAGAWRSYASILSKSFGLDLEGLSVWVHDAGWTPISAFATYVLTGQAAVLTNTHARVLDRYLPSAVEATVAMDLASTAVSPRLVEERKARLVQAAGQGSARQVIESLGGQLLEGIDASSVPLAAGSIDYWHTGNALEHYAPPKLSACLQEGARILRSGGFASHVFDHRDHLHHVDRGWPFLTHRALPEALYRGVYGHPLLYHNRLAPQEVLRLFDQAGLEPALVRRAGATLRYAPDDEVRRQASGLPRWSRTARDELSDLDVRTTYVHYLYRKPGER